MWGCTFQALINLKFNYVFPTHVGVYRPLEANEWSETGFPHACGGVPKPHSFSPRGLAFSPRMWGCTDPILTAARKAAVFPTHVGVYLTLLSQVEFTASFPHACGGVPTKYYRSVGL